MYSPVERMGPGISLPQRTASCGARLLSPTAKKGNVSGKIWCLQNLLYHSLQPRLSSSYIFLRTSPFLGDYEILKYKDTPGVTSLWLQLLIVLSTFCFTLYVKVSFDSSHCLSKNWVTVLPGAKTQNQGTWGLENGRGAVPTCMLETQLNYSDHWRSNIWKRRKIGSSASDPTLMS